MLFFLGTHQVNWVWDERAAGVPLFVSRRRLVTRQALPEARTDFALDSGGFTELQLYGRWTVSVDQYVEEVQRLATRFGPRLKWASPMDWMCEPIVVKGGTVHSGGRANRFHGTGLSVEEHQKRTVANYLELRARLGDLVIPVLQGWEQADYWRCEQMYRDAGADLRQYPTVGLGSVCRRQAMDEAERIVRSLAPLRLHGFGFKKGGVERSHDALVSADSMSWSDGASRRGVLLPGHDQPGPGRRTGHKNCGNCVDYALQWRTELLARIENPQRPRAGLQLDLLAHPVLAARGAAA